METAAKGRGRLRGRTGRAGFVFPRFQPAFDGMFAIVKIMELLAAEGEDVRSPARDPADRPAPTGNPLRLENKGSLMRMLTGARQGEKPSHSSTG